MVIMEEITKGQEIKKKKCFCCKQWKSVDEFYKNKESRDGLSSYCKTCSKKYAKKYNKEHKERRKEYKKKYYNEHKEQTKKYRIKHLEEIKKYQKEYRKNHKEYFKKYYKTHPEKYREYHKKYYKKHPEVKEKSKEYREKNAYHFWANRTLKSHKSKGIQVNLTIDELEEKAKNSKFCPICGRELRFGGGISDEYSATLDRINNENEIKKDNCVILCHRCNTSKYKMNLKEFIEYCEYVTNHKEKIFTEITKENLIETY